MPSNALMLNCENDKWHVQKVQAYTYTHTRAQHMCSTHAQSYPNNKQRKGLFY